MMGHQSGIAYSTATTCCKGRRTRRDSVRRYAMRPKYAGLEIRSVNRITHECRGSYYIRYRLWP